MILKARCFVLVASVSKKTTSQCFKVFQSVSFGFTLFVQKFAHCGSALLTMANLKLYLDGRRLKSDGTALLKISVSHLRKVRYVSLGLSLKPAQWDAERYRVTDRHPSHLRLNNAISRLKLRAEDAFLSVVSSGSRYTLEQIHEAVARAVLPEPEDVAAEKPDPSLLFPVFEKFAATKKESTRLTYERTLAHLRGYADARIRFEDVTRSWLLGFDAAMAKSAPSPNARAIHMRNLRAVFNFAIDEGLTSWYPFRKFHIKTIKTAKRSLSVEELRTLFAADVEPWQEPYLDFFKLSFMLVGINAVDLLHLTPSSVCAGRVEFNRSKTSRLYSLKVEPEAARLLEKYRGERFLLSFMDSRSDYLQFVRQCNHALKAIGTHSRKGLAPVGVPLFPSLTTYWARHSWATVARSIGVSIDDIALALGHGDGHDLTHIYLDEDLQKIDEANRRVLDWVLAGKR